MVLISQVHVHAYRVLTLVEGVKFRGKPIAAADKVGEIGRRPGIQDTDTIRAQAIRRNDVSGKASTRVGDRAWIR